MSFLAKDVEVLFAKRISISWLRFQKFIFVHDVIFEVPKEQELSNTV